MGHAEAISNAEILEKTRDKLCLVGWLSRPMVRLFLTVLEWKHFSPRGGPNEQYEMFIISWPEKEPLRWVVVAIPHESRKDADAVANQFGLRIADGFPHLITADGVAKFPLEGANVFTLEQQTGSDIYKGKSQELHIREEELLDKLGKAIESGLPDPVSVLQNS